MSRLGSLFSQVPKLNVHTLRFPATTATTLTNGVRVAYEAQPDNQNAVVGVAIQAGTRNESSVFNGVARVAELATKQGVASSLSSVGGRVYSSTNRDTTYVIASVPAEQTEKALNVLSEAVQGKFASDVNVESALNKINIEEEAKSGEYVAKEALHRTAFQLGDLATPVNGTAATRSKISTSDVAEFISKHYASARTVVVGSGSVSNSFEQSAAKAFASFENSPYYAAPNCQYLGSDIRIHVEDKHDLDVTVGFRGPKAASADYLTGLLISELIGSWNISGYEQANTLNKLAYRYFDQHQLVNSLQGFNVSYDDTGIMGIHLNLPHSGASDAINYAMTSMIRLCFRLSEEELQIAKNKLKTKLLTANDCSKARAKELGYQTLKYGRRVYVPELVARLDSITADNVKAVAMEYMYDTDPVLAAYGNCVEVPDYNWLRSWSYWLTY